MRVTNLIFGILLFAVGLAIGITGATNAFKSTGAAATSTWDCVPNGNKQECRGSFNAGKSDEVTAYAALTTLGAALTISGTIFLAGRRPATQAPSFARNHPMGT